MNNLNKDFVPDDHLSKLLTLINKTDLEYSKIEFKSKSDSE